MTSYNSREIELEVRLHRIIYQIEKGKEKKSMAELTKVMDQAVKASVQKEGKYLTFMLAGEEYSIGIRKIKQIIGMMPITSVPQTPEFVKGVIKLRGKVIPVMDLKLKFGMEKTDYTERTCIIVMEIEGTTGAFMIGIVVDAVSEVLTSRPMT